jgi:hypothetical protein
MLFCAGSDAAAVTNAKLARAVLEDSQEHSLEKDTSRKKALETGWG